jgi:hypothetical protein
MIFEYERRKNMETIKCYRFVKDDLTSENGEMSWKIGEWNEISGKIVCCSNGLHASLTPRDSIRNVYGQRWFISEARGEIVKQTNKFAASEMRIMHEIPKIILQRFSIWCASDCLKYYEKKYPKDMSVSDCIQAAKDYLDGKIKVDELIKKREAASTSIAGAAGGDAARALAAAIAASLSTVAPNTAAWANAAVAAAYASHTAAVAIDAAIATVDAHATASNVATTAAAAGAADTAATAAHTAAAAGAVAHAAGVAAARNVAPVDSVSDAYYSAFAVFTAFTADAYYVTQNEKLLEMIDQYVAEGTPC